MAARSSFCYRNTNVLKLTQSEILIKKANWDIFERVENTNSEIWKKIIDDGGFPSGYSNGINPPVFYSFKNNEEKTQYRQGQLDHISEYPDISGFAVPYSQRPFPIIQNPFARDISGIECICPNIDLSKKFAAERALLNNTELSIYSNISTYNATFPRSPYKFKSNAEYITYNKIKQFLCT